VIAWKRSGVTNTAPESRSGTGAEIGFNGCCSGAAYILLGCFRPPVAVASAALAMALIQGRIGWKHTFAQGFLDVSVSYLRRDRLA